MEITPVKWEKERLWIIDQTLLPAEYKVIPLDTLEEVVEAICTLRVRGAPAIGVCAAYGVLVPLRKLKENEGSLDEARQCFLHATEVLAGTRPTAYNLFWALARMKEVGMGCFQNTCDFWNALEKTANEIFAEDVERCRKIGEHGSDLVPDGGGILTHCNAGALATSSLGTALSVLYTAKNKGKNFRVFADETRPLLQGARLTAWELAHAGIDVTVICDSTAAHVMSKGWINMVVVGADRIAANGDTANKIGTYSVAVNAKYHRIPFYVAAPLSTIDTSLLHGGLIPIEERLGVELGQGFHRPVVAKEAKVYNPAFDVTPHHLITGIITECGVLYPPFEESIRNVTQTRVDYTKQ